jgi:hypothetical protein
MLQGAGETLRGTLNSTVDRHFGHNARAMEKNQEAIDAGRYEIANRRFYHPDDVGQGHEQQYQTSAVSPSQETFSSSDLSGSSGSERPGSRLGNFLNRATGRPGRPVDVIEEEPRERAKLKKRSSSRLGAVRE